MGQPLSGERALLLINLAQYVTPISNVPFFEFLPPQKQPRTAMADEIKIFKVAPTRPLSDGAESEIKTRRNGTKFIRYQPRGRGVVECEVTTTGRMRVPSEHYYTYIRFADGIKRRVNLKLTDKQAAQKKAMKLQVAEDRKSVGLVTTEDTNNLSLPLVGDPAEIKWRIRPVFDKRGQVIKSAAESNAEKLQNAIEGSWLDIFAEHIRKNPPRGRATTERHVRECLTAIRTAMINCGFKSVPDFARGHSKFQTYLNGLRGRNGKEGSDRTKRYLLGQIKRFEQFLFRRKLMTELPYRDEVSVIVDDKKHHKRRHLSKSEWANARRDLRRKARAARQKGTSPPTYQRITADQVSLIMEFVGLTGLRSTETASIKTDDVDLESLTLKVRSEISKNGKGASLPLHPVLARKLARHMESRAAGFLFDMRTRSGRVRDTSAIMRRVLGEEQYGNKDKGIADFHALRRMFVNALRTVGVHDTVRMELARHAGQSVMARHYDAVTMTEKREAIERLWRGRWEGGTGQTP